MSDWQEQLDKALDDALASYGEGPASEGLPQRILARVAAASARPKRPMWSFARAGVAALIIVTASLFWWVTPRRAAHTSPAGKATVALRKREVAPLRASPVSTFAAIPVKLRKVRIERAPPKLPRFPTPSPLTSEEKALVQFVTSKPEQIPRELTHFGGPIEPIEIAAVEIKPLELRWNTKE